MANTRSITMQLQRLTLPHSRATQLSLRVRAAGALLCAALILPQIAAAGATLERIKNTGQLRLGYMKDDRPFSFRDNNGPEGYAVALCQRVAESLKTQLALPGLTLDWKPVALDERLRRVEGGDLEVV